MKDESVIFNSRIYTEPYGANNESNSHVFDDNSNDSKKIINMENNSNNISNNNIENNNSNNNKIINSINDNISNNQKSFNSSDVDTNNEGIMLMHFICKICNTVPLLIFKSYRLVQYKCKCHESTLQKIEKILDENIYDERINNYKRIGINDASLNSEKDDSKFKISIIIENELKEKQNKPHLLSLKCHEHEEIFSYYCFKCEQNICRKCLSETPAHIEHYTDEIELFDIKYFQINPIVKIIEDNLLIKTKENDSNKYKNLKKLMSIIIEDYKNYPNHSHFSTIASCSQILQASEVKENNKNIIIENKNFVYVKNKRELEDNFANAHYIKTITINKCNKNIISSMELLKSDLINLIELNLSDNCIICIEPLANNKMENLEKLNLSLNDIDDSNIKYFFELDLPKLKDLNLYSNKLTNPELLKFKNNARNLPNLEIFFIGNNKFKFTEKNKDDGYDFSSVIEIGISRNFFNQDSIKYIHCFKLTNLKMIYLSNNNLERFDFINGLELPSITEFWLNNNNFTTFEPLEKYKTLEVIEMKNNNINDIENIEEFIKTMTNLKRFNLEGNKFEYDLLNNLLVDSQVQRCKIIINPY